MQINSWQINAVMVFVTVPEGDFFGGFFLYFPICFNSFSWRFISGRGFDVKWQLKYLLRSVTQGRWLHLFRLVEKQYQDQILAQQEQYQCQIQVRFH